MFATNMLHAWLDDNGSADWVTGCRFVQWQKNPVSIDLPAEVHTEHYLHQNQN